MKIAVGADPFGMALRDVVKTHLEANGHRCIDLGGTSENERPYYEVADDLGGRISKGEFDVGVLVCGTGMGMAIIANKHRGVYAAVCEDASTAVRARSINNANVLTLGAMVTAEFKAKEIVDSFLATSFKSGWSADIQSFLDESMVRVAEIESRRLAKST